MHLRHASRFFLAFYSFLLPHAAATVSQCAIDPSSIVSDACISYSALDSLNADISPSLNEVTQNTDFFAYYRLNLYNKVCPFWTDDHSICGNRACAVDTIDNEKDVPPIWRIEELSRLEGAHAKHPGREQQKQRPKARPLQYQLGEDVDESCVFEDDDECDERDYCIPEDEGATAKGDYVSLVNNTERFTGYSGPGARQVWDAIYQENCFSVKSSQKFKSSSGSSGWLQAAKNLKSVFQEYGRLNVNSEGDSYPLDDECLEQRAFYRIISGMHASISTHLCWDYFNQTTGEWVQNLQCYRDRLHDHPERVSNLYFNYALVTRAIAKLRKHLEHYTFCSGDPVQDFDTKQKVLELADRTASAPSTFDESIMFQDPTMIELKDDFKNRFRNVSRLMDCVGCDKCRLWGKLQTAGYGAALKILLEFDENKNGENPHLRRTELVALMNTLARLSHSLDAVRSFRAAVNAADSKSQNLDTSDPDPSEPRSKNDATQQAREPTVVDDDDDEDFGDLDDDPYPPKETPREQTISEAFQEEFDLVWRAYKMILRSWFELPFKMFAILVMELNRLWNFWLGIPVPDRSWDFHFPSRDEL